MSCSQWLPLDLKLEAWKSEEQTDHDIASGRLRQLELIPDPPSQQSSTFAVLSYVILVCSIEHEYKHIPIATPPHSESHRPASLQGGLL